MIQPFLFLIWWPSRHTLTTRYPLLLFLFSTQTHLPRGSNHYRRRQHHSALLLLIIGSWGCLSSFLFATTGLAWHGLAPLYYYCLELDRIWSSKASTARSYISTFWVRFIWLGWWWAWTTSKGHTRWNPNLPCKTTTSLNTSGRRGGAL